MDTKKNYKLFLLLSFLFCSAGNLVNAVPIDRNVSNYNDINVDIFSGIQNYTDSNLLVKTLKDFMSKADSGKYAEVIPYYDSNFVSIRVVDSGPFIKMNYNQMVSFWKMQATRQPTSKVFSHKAIINQSTTIHNIEILGDTAYILLTRVKDLGSSPEPMFYVLIWTFKKGNWYLFREIVHQRTMPKFH